MEYAPTALSFITVLGAFTAFIAATIGLVQNDIKRVIAYSTMSQLGYMFVAAGVGAYSVAMYHLFTHAFSKQCCFLVPVRLSTQCTMSKICVIMVGFEKKYHILSGPW